MRPSQRQLAQRRYTIAPQMRDYDTLEEKAWLPYAMNFQPPNRVTPSFSTDEHGFRVTLRQGCRLDWREYTSSGRVRSALVGASTAFGVGASSDGSTLPSFLNRQGSSAWFNFAGRAFNSTQELLMFLLYLPPEVERVLIFSGINNLTLSYLSHETSPIYNSFYSQSLFERGLRRGALPGIRGTLRLLAEESLRKLSTQNPAKANGSHPQEKYRHAVACFERDMRIWDLLRRGMGFKLYFVFQPVVPWIDKSLCSEESQLFSLLDQSDPSAQWGGIVAYLRGQRQQYLSDVRDVCARLEVPFLDLNACRSYAEDRWLFVDRAHLTDEGYALAGQEILRWLS